MRLRDAGESDQSTGYWARGSFDIWGKRWSHFLVSFPGLSIYRDLQSLGNINVLILSLPGQRMSSCTCKGEDHAGPDVTYGRGVPEIDVLEGQIDLTVNRGQVSQSAQFAPVSSLLKSSNS